MIPRLPSILLALVLPVVLVTVGALVLGGSSATFYGIPVVLLFMFAMFPLTSLFMWISWRLYDRHGDYQLDELEESDTEVAP